MVTKCKNNQAKKLKNESTCQHIETPAFKRSAKSESIYCRSCSRTVGDVKDAIMRDICEFWHHPGVGL